MVVELLTGEEEMRAFAELLCPEPTADGFEPEERLVICGVSWERYLALNKALGDDGPGPSRSWVFGECQHADLPSITLTDFNRREVDPGLVRATVLDRWCAGVRDSQIARSPLAATKSAISW